VNFFLFVWFCDRFQNSNTSDSGSDAQLSGEREREREREKKKKERERPLYLLYWYTNTSTDVQPPGVRASHIDTGRSGHGSGNSGIRPLSAQG
jgi:hypothetical protein